MEKSNSNYLALYTIRSTWTSAYDIIQFPAVIFFSLDYVSCICRLVTNNAMTSFQILSEWGNIHLNIKIVVHVNNKKQEYYIKYFILRK